MLVVPVVCLSQPSRTHALLLHAAHFDFLVVFIGPFTALFSGTNDLRFFSSRSLEFDCLHRAIERKLRLTGMQCHAKQS